MGNADRTSLGIAPLTWDDSLAAIARGYALDLVRLGFLAHQQPDGAGPADRIRAAGVPFRVVGENIAFSPTIADAYRGIMSSEDHRRNQLSLDFHRAGVGVVRLETGVVVVEDFAD
jgi:uncharacterized protein YkwD